MGFETKWAGAAIRHTRDRRAPKSHRHGSWIERFLSSAFGTVVEGFALYGPAYAGALYPGPFLPADDQPRFPGFGEVRRDGSRAAWEDVDNQTLKDIGTPDETEQAGEPQNRRSPGRPDGLGSDGRSAYGAQPAPADSLKIKAPIAELLLSGLRSLRRADASRSKMKGPASLPLTRQECLSVLLHSAQEWAGGQRLGLPLSEHWPTGWGPMSGYTTAQVEPDCSRSSISVGATVSRIADWGRSILPVPLSSRVRLVKEASIASTTCSGTA